MVSLAVRKENPALRGDRIKSARMLAGYTRKAFADQFQIPVATVRAWEEPPVNRNGVTENGANRLIKIFNESGIYCTIDWIFHGKGPGPTIIDRYKDETLDQEVSWGEEEAILKDIESFKENNRAAMVAVVSDNSMLPFYNYGDYVGGTQRTGREMRLLLGLNCIIEVNGKVLVRRLSMVDEYGRYTLTALNMEQAGPRPVITGAAVTAAAQIVWHRGRGRDELV